MFVCLFVHVCSFGFVLFCNCVLEWYVIRVVDGKKILLVACNKDEKEIKKG